MRSSPKLIDMDIELLEDNSVTPEELTKLRQEKEAQGYVATFVRTGKQKGKIAFVKSSDKEVQNRIVKLREVA